MSLTSGLSFQIAEKLELLLTERESLYATWEDHKTELDQAYDLHVFMRDAKQIDTFTSTQEVLQSFLSSCSRGGQVISVLMHLERFSFECRKTKTKVIPLTNHNSRKQSNEPIRARSKYISPVLSAGKRVRVNHDWFWFYF